MQHHHSGTSVAVVIPVYRATYLGECVASVFAQSRLPDEVIVIDDGSPDAHVIAGAIGPFANRISVVRQPNRGAGAARNEGVRTAGADLVAFLDADDRWYPEFLSEQVARLETEPACTLVYGNARIVGDTPLAGRLFMDGAPSRGEVTVEALLEQRCTVLTSSVVVRRKAVADAGLFDPSLRRGQDFDLWVRLAHRGARFAYTTVPLLDRRVHGENLSGDRVEELERALAVLLALSPKIALAPAERRALDRRVARVRGWIYAEHGKRHLVAGRIAPAREAFRDAARLNGELKPRAAAAALRLAPPAVRYLYLLKSRGTVTPPSSAGGRL